MKHISFGENCIIDSLLKNYNIKNETYPFGSVRTNVEYNFRIIYDNYNFLLCDKFLKRKFIMPHNNIHCINKRYSKTNYNIYCQSVSSNFEFPHHNVIDSIDDLESYKRKVERMKYVLHNDNICFWYHYRYSEKNNLKLLIQIFIQFLSFLKDKYGKKYKICIITQLIDSEKKYFNHTIVGDIHILKCYDKNIWKGTNLGGNVNFLKTHSFIDVFNKMFVEYNIIKHINESK